MIPNIFYIFNKWLLDLYKFLFYNTQFRSTNAIIKINTETKNNKIIAKNVSLFEVKDDLLMTTIR